MYSKYTSPMGSNMGNGWPTIIRCITRKRKRGNAVTQAPCPGSRDQASNLHQGFSK